MRPAGIRLPARKITWILMAFILLGVGALTTVFLGYRRISSPYDLSLSTSGDQSNISISRVHHTATREGVNEWVLEAQSAQFQYEKNRAALDDITVTFFLKDDSRVYLTAEKGVLDYRSNDIEVSGNVVIKNDIYRLQTQQLTYRHQKRIIISRLPVTIAGGGSRLAADAMTFDLNTRRALLKGNVRGEFDEKLAL